MLLFFLIKYVPTTFLKISKKIGISQYSKCLFSSIIESRRRYHNRDTRNTRIHQSPTIVFVSCSMGGITDRFKAMVSLFDFCKQHKLQFKIYSKSPYDFNNYFEPVDYDWTMSLSEYEKVISCNCIFNAWLSSGECDPNEWQNQQKVICSLINTKYYSHIFIHASAPYGHPNFSSLFSELFRPTETLSKQINNHLTDLGRYITISFRFVNLLNDSNEQAYGIEQIESREKTQMISQCISNIKDIINNSHDIDNCLITTDSFNFLQIIKSQSLPKVTFLEGSPIHHHIGFTDTVPDKEITKSLLEFMLISHATCAFQVRIGNMYESKFPKWAASVGNVPYTLITEEIR